MYTSRSAREGANQSKVLTKPHVDLYTILPLPILYGVWHTQGGSGGGRRLRIRRAIILQSSDADPAAYDGDEL